MKTINIKFTYEGVKYNYNAILSNDLNKLSSSKKNDATDVVDDFGDNDRWSIHMEIGEEVLIEVVLYRDEDGEKTTDIEYIILWNNGVIEAEIGDIEYSVK